MSGEQGNDGMLDIYLFENGQLLEKLQDIVLEQKDESFFDEDAINEIFRIMHTIKGSSSIMMFDDITKVSHKLEDVFFYLRESGQDNVSHMELVEHVLEVADFIMAELQKINDGEDADGDSAELVKKIDDFLCDIMGEGNEEPGAEMSVNEQPVAQQFYIAPAATESSKFYKIWIQYHEETQMANIRAYTAVYALKDVAEDLLYTPDDIIVNEESSAVILEEGFRILLQSQAQVKEIKSLIDGTGITKIDIKECTAEEYQRGFDFLEPSQSQETKEKKEEKELKPGDFVIESKSPGKKKKLVKKNSSAPKQSFISVNVEKLDILMDLIGELVISEAVVLQNPDLNVPGLELTNFKKASAQLMKISSDLQDAIMSMRMMPLTNTFQKMNRIVFDVSRKLDKDVELVLEGESTEVDKNIIEHISDPLMHLIRNAVDHGVETPKERKAVGKPEKATITLSAKNEGGKVWISVKDDGGGMSRQKILEKAKRNGLLGKRDEASLSDKEVYQFITSPGFSTKENVSEYSGRGVGMDVVVKNIQEVGGTLDIDSVQGEGSTFTLKIPLTLAIINGMVMEIGGSSYAIETGSVREFVQVSRDMLIHENEPDECIMIRGECYPVIRLSKWFGIENGEQDIEKGAVLIMENEGSVVCLFADRLVREQEIVVKPMPSYIKKIK
ncbi:MAG: chemotaxis protein CheA, partial [Lachnospiraceae bacterium]|nr:chemotaxis protein CheA [Lachnospiraceae bacterium]